MHPQPELISTIDKVWARRFYLPRQALAIEVQATVAAAAAKSHQSIVGYYDDSIQGAHVPSLTLLHWPETRGNYVPTNPDKFEQTLDALYRYIPTGPLVVNPIPANSTFCLMGRLRDGYSGGNVASMGQVRAAAGSELNLRPVHMVSARRLINGEVEEYSEPAVAVSANQSHGIEAIHNLGHALSQHHYVITLNWPHDGIISSSLYQTPYAASSGSEAPTATPSPAA